MAPPIAILGGGPAGLTLARLLEMAKVDYTVFERDSDSNARIEQGGCLDLHEGSGLLALEEAGLLERFKQVARYDATSTIATAEGEIVGMPDHEGERSPRPEIDRKDLRTLLLGSIPQERVRWGSHVVQVQRSDDGKVSVHFKDGSVASGFQLVVGADGARSKVRDLVSVNGIPECGS